jgi:phospholipid/cholesterol/gamma-HCH transport system substrate-binding protein
MNKSNTKEIKVGIVTLLAIILLIAGISIGNNLNVRVDYKRISMRFPNSAGIEKTSPVFVNGVKRGAIVSVKPDNGTVLITADIDDIDDFREDVKARIGILEITGGKKIDINPGLSSSAYNIKNEIEGIASPDIGEMVAMLGDMGYDAKNLLRKLDTMATAGNKLLTDKRIEESLANTSSAIESMNYFIQNNIKSLETTVANLKSITVDLKSAINKYEPRIDNLSNKIDKTLDDTQNLMKSADAAIENANNLITELKTLTEDARKQDGLVGKLIYDKQFASNLDSTIQSLNNFILLIKEHGININARLGTRP